MRRGAGEGNIRKRDNGTWEARIRGVDADGRPVRRSIYGRTRKEVAAELAKQSLARGQGLPIEQKKITVGQWVAHWLENYTKGVRPGTLAGYDAIVRNHITGSSIAGVALAKLRPDQVQTWVNALSTKPVAAAVAVEGEAPRTLGAKRVTAIVQVLNAAMKRAERQGLIVRNPVTGVSLPKVQRAEIRPLDEEQTKSFLAAIEGDRFEAFYLTCLGCGLRRGEALGLRWVDVDLDGATLTVSGALQREKKKGRVRVEPKTAKSRRTIPMPPSVVEALKEHGKRQKADRLRAGSEWVNTVIRDNYNFHRDNYFFHPPPG